MKKKIIGLLAGIMVCTLTACGGKSEEVKNSKEFVYRAEEISLEEIEDKNSISNFSIQGDRLFITGYHWEENGRTIYVVNRSIDGADTSTITIDMEDNQSMSFITVDGQGNIYAVFDEYFEDSSDPDNYIWEDNYYLMKLDNQGKELWRQQLNEKGSEDYYGVNSLQLTDDGRIVLIDTVGIKTYDAQGGLLKAVRMQEDSSGNDIYKLKDGTFVANIFKTESNKFVFRKLDIETGELLPEESIVPGMAGSYNYYPGAGYDFLLVDSTGVSGYNLGDEEIKPLMNFIDSDLNSNYVYNIQAVSQTEFYGMMNDDVTGETALLRFTKVAPEDIVEKTVLTLGTNGVNWDVRNRVVQFNKSNEKYRIRINDYAQYNTDEDYNAGMTKLNTDIASGNVPDILVLDSNLPVESYISKGLFEDLYPYIDKDEELNRDKYFSNILQAFETDGKLYQLVPSFAILTVAGKTKDVGAETGWTLKELNEILASKPEGTQVFAQEIRSTILDYSIQMSSEQFIDWETGKCSFDSEGFTDLLVFLKQFPEKYEDEDYNDSYWRDYNSLWRQDKVLLRILQMDTFQAYNTMKKGIYGEDITLKGFPAENKKGSAIMPNLNIAMSSKSGHKDGVWEFIRYFLSDEYQNTIEYGWPLSRKKIDDLAEKAKKRPFYEDEEGNIVEYDEIYYVDDMEIPISPMTDAEIEEVLNFIKSLDQVYTYDANLINIISEEAAPYFAGQKNAKEVAEIIQSRIQIYVNENR